MESPPWIRMARKPTQDGFQGTIKNAPQIIEKTVKNYLQHCELKGSWIIHSILDKSDSGFIYMLKVGNVSHKQATKHYIHPDMNLEQELIFTLDDLFTHICKKN